MISEDITKEELIKAIEEIKQIGIRNGRHSSTYDLIYEGERYPPKLVLSIAHRFLNGEELDPNGFKGGRGTAAFKLLEREGFEIKNKLKLGKQVVNYSEQLKQFLEQAKSDNLKTKHYVSEYSEMKVKVSFGQGVAARIPWISFLKEPHTTSEGIYPVYLFYKKIKKLVLAYGVSETNKPQTTWKIDNEIKIKDYFDEKGYDKPARYGDSFFYKIYDTSNLPNNNELDSDLNEIIHLYKNMEVSNNNNSFSIEGFNLSSFQDACKDSGLKYAYELVTRFISSLATKPFVLLTGLSGSGKTKLAQSFAKWICENKNQYCIVPVGADWTNREPLLGYVNALDNSEYIIPENGALQLIIRANEGENQNKPYFLILDEMNLSHVERYFADFLSVMESKDKFKLHAEKEKEISGVKNELNWPKNLFVIGTVNIDETTYMFSPKVLDRANVIEFRVNETEIKQFLNDPKEIDLKKLESEGKNMSADFIKLAENKNFADIATGDLNDTLVKFFVELKKTGAEFGYRTGMEIHRLFLQLSVINPGLEENNKIDFAIMQKLLPKLHGSRSKLTPILKTLAILCYGDNEKFDKEEKDKIFANENTRTIRYPLSLEKITRMYNNVVSNGFTSYAEA